MGDDGEEVVAEDVIKQSGGIENGANGPRTTFAAGVQFSISDPAYGKVRRQRDGGAGWAGAGSGRHGQGLQARLRLSNGSAARVALVLRLPKLLHSPALSACGPPLPPFRPAGASL